MTESIEAIIKPELLIWARKSAGLTLADAAKKAQVSEDKLNEWETGKSRPSISQLRKLGKVYKRPIAVFYLPEPPKPLKRKRTIASLQSANKRAISIPLPRNKKNSI